ncbi:MAG: hypothetical protein LUF04_00340 [Bacteroides sp.]|nr:hypothetical protein [Bacteroides sp.]
MKKVKTLKHTCPKWEGWLFVSLLMADGGDGFEENEIQQAEEFIRENGIFSIAETKELPDDEVELEFVLN